jgi:hypothetical protein
MVVVVEEEKLSAQFHREVLLPLKHDDFKVIF